MIAAWMLYLTAVSLLLAFSARALERGFAARGWPLRPLWAAALLTSALLPLFVALSSSRSPSLAAGGAHIGGVQAVGVVPMSEGGATATLAARLAMLDTPLLVGWGIASAAFLVLLLWSALQLRWSQRTWRAADVEGTHVMLSRDTGPAVVGFVRSRVVLPEWVLDLDGTRRALLLAHEEEHLRAGDPRLLLCALATLAVAPWNLALWWQLHRLRLAVEVDCDARVLRRTSDVGAYGSLLLEVGARRSRRPTLGAAFSEPSSSLEQRLIMMTERSSRRSWSPLLLGCALAVVLVLAACELDQPGALVSPSSRPVTETEAERPALAEEPTFTPYTQKPELVNAEEVRQLLKEAYPPALRAAGVGGTAVLWVFVDEQGRVQNTRVADSSGEPALDDAAEAVMRQMRFRPAANQGEDVPVWIQLPITFQANPQPSEGAVPPAGDPAPPGAEQGGSATPSGVSPVSDLPSPPSDPVDVSAQPTFTPFDGRPELQNRGEFARVLSDAYPAELKEAGVRGTTVLWVYLNAEGRVARTRVADSSGHPELDEAAQSAIREARFSPATLRGEPRDVWIQLPVSFHTP